MRILFNTLLCAPKLCQNVFCKFLLSFQILTSASLQVSSLAQSLKEEVFDGALAGPNPVKTTIFPP